MPLPRVIPTVLLRRGSLVKTRQFRSYEYVGDPCNTVRIFNEFEVDEMFILDTVASRDRVNPNFELLGKVAKEAFMPLAYGGGITTVEHARRLFEIGFEKICVRSAAFADPYFVQELATLFGSQAVVVSIDVKNTHWQRPRTIHRGGRTPPLRDPVQAAQTFSDLGAGEILLTSIDREGTWAGFDLELVSKVANEVPIPVIAHGGCGSLQHIRDLFAKTSSTAAAVGSMFTFQGPGKGVLISYLDWTEKTYVEDVERS